MKSDRRIAAILTVLLTTSPCLADELTTIEMRLAVATHRYDAQAANAVLSQLRSAGSAGDSESLVLLRVQAGLAVAELLRIEFEGTPQDNRVLRRTLGQRIDATAEEALELVTRLSASSETSRMRADLIGTMMRSDFRARKFEKRFNAAASRALELDESNPRAWVTVAKPFVFAPPERGRDLDEAIRRLDCALDLAPTLESARLLRALAYEMSGNSEAARADWSEAIRVNPDCAPAQQALETWPTPPPSAVSDPG